MVTSIFKASSCLRESGHRFEREAAPEGCDDRNTDNQLSKLLRQTLWKSHNKSPSTWGSASSSSPASWQQKKKKSDDRHDPWGKRAQGEAVSRFGPGLHTLMARALYSVALSYTPPINWGTKTCLLPVAPSSACQLSSKSSMVVRSSPGNTCSKLWCQNTTQKSRQRTHMHYVDSLKILINQ